MESKSVLIIAAVAMFALAIGQVQAGSITVPGGDFAMYKPGTGYTVTATFSTGNSYAQGVGDGLTLADGTVDYSDGTSGTAIDMPGWVGPYEATSGNDLFSAGYDELDGTTAFHAFGTWSGGNGTLVESSESLGQIIGGATYTVSAMVSGSAGPMYLELLAGGVPMTASSSVDPNLPIPLYTNWEVISRTYDAAATGAVAGEPLTILMGTFDEGGVYVGTRVVFDNVTVEFDGMNPSPAYGETVETDEFLELSWTNLPPVDGNDVYVDVWFGTEPNELHPDYDMTLIVVADVNTIAVVVDASVKDTYYWQVNSYVNGADKINDSNMIEGSLWLFYAVDDFAPSVEIVTVDMMTWSGEGVPVDVTVTDDAKSIVTIEWIPDDDSFADLNLTFDIEAGAIDPEDATVTITKLVPTGGVVTVTMTVAVSDEGNPIPDTASIEIDVYDTACHLARIGLDRAADHPADFDENCKTGLEDLAEMVATWLNESGLTEAVIRY